MYQKCPQCNGTGKEYPPHINASAINCSVCNGKKIINQETGHPPM